MILVKNMKSPRSNKPVAQQFIIENKSFFIFQSYKTPICAITKDRKHLIIFDYLKNLNVSPTTNKYLQIFLSDFNFEIICRNPKIQKELDKEKVLFRKLEIASRENSECNVYFRSVNEALQQCFIYNEK